MNAPTPLEAIVHRLDELLTEESGALRRMDSDKIVELSDAKAEILRELGGASRSGASRETLQLVARVREKALANQLLLVHARDLIRGLVQSMGAVSVDGKTPGAARLLEVRG